MLPYQNAIPVAAHRGNARYFPENTLASFRSALELKPDMLETDLHMTRDGHLVLMHDHRVDRTTDGTGLIREKTLSEMRALDAGAWKGEAFRGEKVPTFEEFLALVANVPGLLYNIELKDYPADSGAFAYQSARKAIDMLREAGILSRCVINSWSGELNEWLSAQYGDEIKIHAYSPQERMGPNQKRFVYDYAYCVCLFGTKNEPVVSKSLFDFARGCGVEPWVFYANESAELYDAAIANGARLFTANDPAWAMNYLREKGLHQ